MGRQQQITVTSDLTGVVLPRDTEPYIFKIIAPDESETELEVFLSDGEYTQFLKAVKEDNSNIIAEFKPGKKSKITTAPTDEPDENKAALVSLREAANLTGRGEDSKKFKDLVDGFITQSEEADAPAGREGKPYSFNMTIPQKKALDFLKKNQDDFLAFVNAGGTASAKANKKAS